MIIDRGDCSWGSSYRFNEVIIDYDKFIQILLQLLKMKHQFLLFILLVSSITTASVAPTWIRDFKIDAGEVKAVNFGNGTQVSAGASHSFNQPFVNGSFTTVPRFIYAMNSYGISPTAQFNTTSIGYSIAMTNLLTTYYVLTVTAKGIRMISLYYHYIAIEGYTTLYFISMDNTNYTTKFDAASPLVDTAAGAERNAVVQFRNPSGYTINQNINDPALLLRVWPVSFTYTPKNDIISFKLLPSIVNRTSFSLSITVKDGFSLEQLRIAVLYVNKTLVFEHSYTQVIVHASQIHVGTNTSLTTNVTNTYTTQLLQYRNVIFGYRDIYMPLVLNSINTFLYTAVSTSPLSVRYLQVVQQSIRNCSTSFPIFRTQDSLCHDSCPTTGYYINSTFKFCNKCHQSCLTCTSNTATSCTSCNASNIRTLTNNNSCPCSVSYYEDSAFVCLACHYTCLNCIGPLKTECSGCLGSLNRQLVSNASCLCLSGYYENVTCMLCSNSCTTCTFHSANQTYECLSCPANSSKAIVNASCVCPSGTFEQNSTCKSCGLGCLSCSSLTVCLTCNASAFFRLVGTACSCFLNYLQNGSICESNGIAICGNSILQSGQACDDGNLFNVDGCSLTCTIQPDHSCIYNITLSSKSICYYDKKITFTVFSVFKKPLQNGVKLTLAVSAINCNETYLQSYLQNNPSLELRDNARLLTTTLNSPDITNARAEYDAGTDQLVIDFQYNKNIDLSKKEIVFSPSSSINQDTAKYFYDSPKISTRLQSPTNKILTTFLTLAQISTYQLMANIFLALVVLWWVCLIVAMYFNQTAIMVESFLIIQMAYESLIRCQFIYEGWGGLILYGKYTYGYNVPYISVITYDQLQVLSLNAFLFNTLNITASIMLTAILTLLFIFIYETIKIKMLDNDQSSEDVTKPEGDVEFQDKIFQIKRFITILLFEISLTFSFLTVKIVTMNLFYLNDEVKTNTLALSIVLYLFYAIIWILYFRFYQQQFFMDLSFKKILRAPKDNIDKPMLDKMVEIYVKYYYFIIFIGLIGFGVLNSVNMNGIAFFMIIMASAIIFVIIGATSNVYYRKENTFRSIANIVFFSIVMIMHILQSQQIKSFVQSNIEPIIGISMLASVFAFNSGIFVRIQYKRYRNNKKIKNRRQNRKKVNVTNDNRNQTQEPHLQKITIFENIMQKKPAENILDHSQQYLAHKSNKFSVQERSEVSMPQTNKKIARRFQQNQDFYDKTREKQFEQVYIEKNIQNFSGYKKDENSPYKKTIQKYNYRQKHQQQQKHEPQQQEQKEQQKKEAFQELQIINMSRSFSNRSMNNKAQPRNIDEIKTQQQGKDGKMKEKV